MAGRGRGRGGGGTFSSRDMSERLNLGPGETQPETVCEPPPLYPVLENRPAPLDLGIEGEYLLALKREFVEYMHDSPAFLQYTIVKSDIERYSDRYQTAPALVSRSVSDLVRDWKFLPSELRENSGKAPRKRKKTGAASAKASKASRKTEDITNRLEELEKREEQGNAELEGANNDGEIGGDNAEDKDKDADSEVEEEVDDEEVDEEMDDGTDYIQSYFDNGEEYVDEEDDNLDDGAIY